MQRPGKRLWLEINLLRALSNVESKKPELVRIDVSHVCSVFGQALGRVGKLRVHICALPSPL
jgi:hypothetical protein